WSAASRRCGYCGEELGTYFAACAVVALKRGRQSPVQQLEPAPAFCARWRRVAVRWRGANARERARRQVALVRERRAQGRRVGGVEGIRDRHNVTAPGSQQMFAEVHDARLRDRLLVAGARDVEVRVGE